MTTKSNGVSNTDLNSVKWKTDFKEITEPKSLPTYLDNALEDESTGSSGASGGADSPQKELLPIVRAVSFANTVSSHGSPRESLDLLSGNLSSDDFSDECGFQPLDVKQKPKVTIDSRAAGGVHFSNNEVTIADVETQSQCPEVVDGRQIRAQSEPPTILQVSNNEAVYPIKSSSSSQSIDLSLSKIESKPVVAELDDSLDLFTDVKNEKNAKATPPRPPKPKVEVNAQSHPLMLAPDPDPEFISTYGSKSAEQPRYTSLLNAKFSKTANYINKKRSKSPNPPLREVEKCPTINAVKEKCPTIPPTIEDTGSGDSGDATADTSMTEPYNSSTRKQKFKALKSNLMGKAYNKYSQLNEYYYGGKKQQTKLQDGTLDNRSERVSSDSGSEGGFYEITNDDISVAVEAAGEPSSDESEVAYMATPEETSVSYTPAVTPAVTPVSYSVSETADSPPPPSAKNVVLGYQNHVICASLVALFSVLCYFTFYHCSTFFQGVVVGVFIPVVGGVIVVLKTRPSPNDGSVETRAAQQCNRLRQLGAKSSLKDFFQYTESHNFGDLRIKAIPYRYFKLKGSIIEAYELNASKDQVQDPLKLSHAEVKRYGLQLIFKIDISGWLVSVEAPPGYEITASNMWKKRYPIWVRKINWRSETAEYDAGMTVNSFYLMSAYSRYKEHWYEALRKAVSLTVGQNDIANAEQENYRHFMERLFHQLPTLQDPPLDSTTSEEGSSGEQVNTDVRSKHPDMQNTAWVNALFGRFVWNILNDVQWEKRIRDRIVRKLSSVSTRHISSIELKSFDLGDSVPLITKTHLPKIDHQGVWSEMDLDWSGEVSLSLVARINTKPAGQVDNTRTFEPMKLESERATEYGSSGKLAKLYKILERIEIGVSAKVSRVAGRLCVNIPPPPTDCLWYGFTEPPELKISLTPILGRWISLDYRPITNALEKQLQSLFNDTFVLPAMENIVSPGMSRDMQTRQEHIPTTLNMDLLEATEEDLLDVAARKGSVL